MNADFTIMVLWTRQQYCDNWFLFATIICIKLEIVATVSSFTILNSDFTMLTCNISDNVDVMKTELIIVSPGGDFFTVPSSCKLLQTSTSKLLQLLLLLLLLHLHPPGGEWAR